MIINPRLGILATHGVQHPRMIVLHHTAGGTRQGAESTLRRRGLGYHFIIDRDGKVFQYGSVKQVMWHAKDFNRDTVGIAFVGGGGHGSVNDEQWQSVIELINRHVKMQAPGLLSITGHKHCSPGQKIDPQFYGEPDNGTDLGIDAFYMAELAKETNLDFAVAPSPNPQRR